MKVLIVEPNYEYNYLKQFPYTLTPRCKRGALADRRRGSEAWGMGDHRPDFQKLISTARSDDRYARSDAVFQLVQFGREAEAVLVALLAETTDSGDRFGITRALGEVGLKYSLSVDAIVGLLNVESHRWDAADLLLHCSPKLRRHLPTIRAILERETEPRLKERLQKLLDRYPNFSVSVE